MQRAWLVLMFLAAPAWAAPKLTLTPISREPAEGRRVLEPGELAALRVHVKEQPKDRAARLALVQALVQAKKLEEARDEARAWREKDAYNLVVVRALGDIFAEMGQREQAERTYSAVVELLPKDAQAHRALATVLKQSGQLDAAYARLASAAELAPKDRRIAFELADAALRLGRTTEAREQLAAIVAADDVEERLRYPAKQRLAQIYAAERRVLKGNAERQQLDDAIAKLRVQGGLENDIKIYLTWDTDHSDIDLWVTTPSGERVFYRNKQGSGGEALYDDVTTGYGPESFTAPTAQPGAYLVEVNYYGAGRSAFVEARGEVTVILHEGTPEEKRVVLPYRLYEPKQTVTVARIEVSP